jgi:predicted ATP-dependent endonuclease of OLD family
MAILDEKAGKVKLNCQLIITSHSANIVHGKLQTENTFNNINYISCLKDSSSFIVSLDDASTTPSGKNTDGEKQEKTEDNVRDETKTEAQFNFLKKHIKYNCCDLFFADACLVVEGYAEQIILPFYLERDERINKKFISILNINGAFSHVYNNLFKKLNIPIAIITDLDIEGSSCDNQITSLEGKKTTNPALKGFGFTIGKDFQKQDKNVYVVTQEKVGDYYPTSFEESYILSNVNNIILKNTLSSVIPKTFETHKNQLVEKSHMLLNKIGSSNKKGEFATKLLYNLINAHSSAELPKLPVYIQEALDYVSISLNGSDEAQKSEEEVTLDA